MEKVIIRSNPKHAGYEMESPVLFISKIEPPFTAQENPFEFDSKEAAQAFILENLSSEENMWDIVPAMEENLKPSQLSEIYE